MTNLYMSNHFIERYNERVLNKDGIDISRKHIFNDINNRMTVFEKRSIDLLIGNKGTLKIPLGSKYQLIIRGKTLITVY